MPQRLEADITSDAKFNADLAQAIASERAKTKMFDATCVVCYDRQANQMPFKCQHVLVCEGEGRSDTANSSLHSIPEGWTGMRVVWQKGETPVRLEENTADDSKKDWKVYLP